MSKHLTPGVDLGIVREEEPGSARMPKYRRTPALDCPPEDFLGKRNKLVYSLSHGYFGSPFLAAEQYPNAFRNMLLIKKGYYKGKAFEKHLAQNPEKDHTGRALS